MNKIYHLEIKFESKGEKQILYPSLLKDNDQLILVDCGYPGFLPLIEAQMKRIGFTIGKKEILKDNPGRGKTSCFTGRSKSRWHCLSEFT